MTLDEAVEMVDTARYQPSQPPPSAPSDTWTDLSADASDNFVVDGSAHLSAETLIDASRCDGAEEVDEAQQDDSHGDDAQHVDSSGGYAQQHKAFATKPDFETLLKRNKNQMRPLARAFQVLIGTNPNSYIDEVITILGMKR